MDLSLNSKLVDGMQVIRSAIKWRDLRGSKATEFMEILEGYFRQYEGVDCV